MTEPGKLYSDFGSKLFRQLVANEQRTVYYLLSRVMSKEVIEFVLEHPHMGYVVAAGAGAYVRKVTEFGTGRVVAQLVEGDARKPKANNQLTGRVVEEVQLWPLEVTDADAP